MFDSIKKNDYKQVKSLLKNLSLIIAQIELTSSLECFGSLNKCLLKKLFFVLD